MRGKKKRMHFSSRCARASPRGPPVTEGDYVRVCGGERYH